MELSDEECEECEECEKCEEENFGKLYCLKDGGKGEWIQGVISIISLLNYGFNEVTEDLPNGINIIYDPLKRDNVIGDTISSFLVRCYVIKRFTIRKDNGEQLLYLSPVNLILDTYLNKEKSCCLDSIRTILNHPHFQGCKSIEDITKKIDDVNDFNMRFKKSKS